MKLKRAIWTGIALWFAALILGIVIMLIAGAENATSTPVAVVGLLALLILTYFAATHYFKPRTITCSTKAGLHLGLIFFIVGSILDFVTLWIPSMVVGKFSEVLQFYSSPFFVVGVALLIAVPVVVGMKGKK